MVAPKHGITDEVFCYLVMAVLARNIFKAIRPDIPVSRCLAILLGFRVADVAAIGSGAKPPN